MPNPHASAETTAVNRETRYAKTPDGVYLRGKDLVAGSGLHFSDRGIHTFKGVPEPWHLYAVFPN